CKTDGKKIYLLAHSMGTRILMRSLADVIAANPSEEKDLGGRCKYTKEFQINKIAGVILAAADLDYDYFNRSVAKMLVDNKIFTTIYASSEDVALGYSEYKHKYQRIGEVGKSPFVRDGIDTIDISQANSSLIGHSDFAESPLVLKDLEFLIKCHYKAEQRKGLAKRLTDKACSSDDRGNSPHVSAPKCSYWTIEPYLYDLYKNDSSEFGEDVCRQ
ncbi:MAG: alpha/beta hydrolase, partial [Acidobacteriota bacterium]